MGLFVAMSKFESEQFSYSRKGCSQKRRNTSKVWGRPEAVKTPAADSATSSHPVLTPIITELQMNLQDTQSSKLTTIKLSVRTLIRSG